MFQTHQPLRALTTIRTDPPSVSLCLCVSQVLKLPGIGNTETQRTRRVCVKGVLISRTRRPSPTVQYPNPYSILLPAFQKNSVPLCLCVSQVLKLPGIGNTETQRTRRVCEKGVGKLNTAPMTDCSISKSLLDPSYRFPKKLCVSVPLCFKFVFQIPLPHPS